MPWAPHPGTKETAAQLVPAASCSPSRDHARGEQSQMRQLDALDLISRIGRELQPRFTYSDIDEYFARHGVATPREYTGPNSKWSYVKSVLADAPLDLVVRLANELEIPHSFATIPTGAILESRFWRPQHFRLFITHLARFRRKAKLLRDDLLRYGVSSFVAHIDVEPSREWQHEIEAALHSMHALAAILMPGYQNSDWTDQEVGFALGKGVPVVPIMRGLAPYGFKGKIQGIDAAGKTVRFVTQEILDALAREPTTRPSLLMAVTDAMLTSQSASGLLACIQVLERQQALPPLVLDHVADGAGDCAVLVADPDLRTRVDVLLDHHGRQAPRYDQSTDVMSADDLPF